MIFLGRCSPAELIYVSIDRGKCKHILGSKSKCKFVTGLTDKLNNKCKLIFGRVIIYGITFAGDPRGVEETILYAAVENYIGIRSKSSK
ncbi:MAG: hypothetical protein ACI80H_000797 [Pseudoalteromonas distincta]|jgi:hypothetical protein